MLEVKHYNLLKNTNKLNHFQKQRLIRIERIKAEKKELAHAKEIEKAYKDQWEKLVLDLLCFLWAKNTIDHEK